MPPKLSIILPSIRSFLLEGFYNSLKLACKDSVTYELIIISPYDIPTTLKNDNNIKYIFDKGSPSRALQIGLINSVGDYVTTISDDSIMYEDIYIKAINQFETLPKPYRMLVMGFQEGSVDPRLHNGQFTFLHAYYHKDLRVGGFPLNTPMALQFIIDRSTLIEIGGWDCINYQDGNWGGHDMTGRLMNLGIKFSYLYEPANKNYWAPGPDGMFNDHRPVYESSDHGIKVFKEMWDKPNNRIKIDINNWKQSPAVWKLRFKE